VSDDAEREQRLAAELRHRLSLLVLADEITMYSPYSAAATSDALVDVLP
jgi:hypothetical protein